MSNAPAEGPLPNYSHSDSSESVAGSGHLQPIVRQNCSSADIFSAWEIQFLDFFEICVHMLFGPQSTKLGNRVEEGR